LAGAIVSSGVLVLIRLVNPLNAYAYAPIGLLTCVAVGWLASFLAPERKNLSGLTVFDR
jgi:hypothetical protein